MIHAGLRFSYLLPPLLGAVLTTVLLVVVLVKSAKDNSSRLFAALLGSMTVWCLVTFAMRASPNEAAAMPWEKALVAAVLFVYFIYYHFTTTYVRARRRGITAYCYLLLLTFILILALTDLVIKDVTMASYGYAPVTGPLAGPFFAASFILIMGGMVNLIRAYRASGSSDERNRLLYLAVAGLFPLIGGGLDGLMTTVSPGETSLSMPPIMSLPEGHTRPNSGSATRVMSGSAAICKSRVNITIRLRPILRQ